MKRQIPKMGEVSRRHAERQYRILVLPQVRRQRLEAQLALLERRLEFAKCDHVSWSME